MINSFQVIFTNLYPNIFSFIILIVLIIFAFKKINEKKWAKTFILTQTAVIIWILGDFIVQTATNPVLFNLGGKILYTGIVTTPYFWLLFTLSYGEHDQWITKKRLFALGIIPVITLIIMYFDSISPVMRTVTAIDSSGPLIKYTVQYGPWFWVHTAFSYLLLLLAGALQIYSAIGSSKLFAGQKILLIIASLFPWAANILYVLGVTNSIDYTTIAFTFLAFVLMVNFIKFKFLDIGPIARSVIFEHMVDPVIVLDMSNKVIDINPPAIQLIKQDKSKILGYPFSKTFPEFDFLLKISNPIVEFRKEIGIPKNNPKNFYSVKINSIFNKQSLPIGKVVVLRNINDQEAVKKELLELNFELENRVAERTAALQKELENNQKIQMALRESDERYALSIEGANDGIWDWQMSTGEVFYSTRWKAMIGYSDEEIAPTIQSWLDRVHMDDRWSLQVELSKLLDNNSDSFEHSHRLICKDGNPLWVLCRGMVKRGKDGGAIRMSGSLTDISRHKQYEEQILFDALHDQLTGLPNRAYIIDKISHAIERGKRHKNDLFAVIFLDLDRFKNVNDSLGHSTGDLLLQATSKRLMECLRSIDTLSRIGGDEFVILIDSLTGIEEAKTISDRIINSLSESFTLQGNKISISASLGIVVFSDQYKNADQILGDADIAMYQAKKNAYRRYEIFNSEMRKKAEVRLNLETELRHALQFNEFELFYQPILHVKEISLVSFEALIRWQKPGKGCINPSDFIPTAEETSLIIPIGQWVIREACKQIADWKTNIETKDMNIVVNINLSARQISDPQLCSMIKNCLNEFNIEGKNLVIEITESVIIDEKEKAITTLKELRDMGIQIQIDDFGTGYSSLSYLHTLPFDALKIDQSFINQMCFDDSKTGIEIVQTIITLSKELGKKVIAEGVESQKALDMLTNMECGYFQGYLVSKPLNKMDASNFLAKEFSKLQKIPK